MTSKWISELMSCVSYDTTEQYTKAMNVLERVDAILRLAKSHTDSEILYDMIEKETFTSDDTIKFDVSEIQNSLKSMTGVSSVVPVTEQEAERIFKETKGDES